ncbi:uncharacterized protein LOC117170569 [Belonocnema kinseyi]|uniref:uncharacterized protein LOC117170569 n=1 Tax=Belonocnema kinseyi TaxID=2817044 RepID=UPI00143D001B|nr:uncharacterized protein LOC117170569 [Belonocnema kinseyi]
MDELICNTCKILDLPLDGVYKIVLEGDRAEFEEFEDLTLLAKRYSMPTCLMILPKGDVWETPELSRFSYEMTSRTCKRGESASESLCSRPSTSIVSSIANENQCSG